MLTISSTYYKTIFDLKMFANHPEVTYNMNQIGMPLEPCSLQAVTKNDDVDIWNQLQSLGMEALTGKHYWYLI